MSNDMPSCYSLRIRKARKQHQCCECLGFIQPGEQYNYHSGIWEGKARSYTVCIECDDLRAEIDEPARYDEGTPFGYIAETLTSNDYGVDFHQQFLDIQIKRGATLNQRMVIDLAEAVIK